MRRISALRSRSPAHCGAQWHESQNRGISRALLGARRISLSPGWLVPDAGVHIRAAINIRLTLAGVAYTRACATHIWDALALVGQGLAGAGPVTESPIALRR